MRKKRLIIWIISIIICFILLFYSEGRFDSYINQLKTKIETSKEQEEASKKQKEVTVYIFKDDDYIKERIDYEFNKRFDSYSYKDTTEDADFVISDDIPLTQKDEFETIAYTPVIVCMDSEKVNEYEEYLITEDDTINFAKVFEEVILGEWTEMIYCPNVNTAKGKVFYDFLIITANNGQYPKNVETLEKCKQRANLFLNSDLVMQIDVQDRLKKIKKVSNEFYILFENELISIEDGKFYVAYPEYTTIYKIYFRVKGENKKELRELLTKSRFKYSLTSILDDMSCEFGYRNDYLNIKNYINADYHIKKTISYVEIP